MKKQFCTYGISLKLKKLGFDEECFALFTASLNDNKFDELKYLHEVFDVKHKDFVKNSWLTNEKSCTAPLWQQAIDWFETKEIAISFTYLKGEWYYKIYYKGELQPWNMDLNTYKKTRENAILKAIELCEKNL